MQAWEKAGNKFGVDARWEHCIMIFDGQGNLIDSWNQYDSMLQRPHFVAISPYDPMKHVWIVDDHKHVIHKFTNDGKTKVMTIGTYGEPGADDKHFNRPTFMDWFPDGSFVVADGYNGTRVVKFDKDGKYLTAWGQKGEAGKETRPGYFNNVHGVAVDPKTRQVFVNDRGNRRAQVFDENGKFLREWSFGDAPADIHLFHIFSDGYLWAADRGTSKMLKYDLDGTFMYSWGTWGDFPGGMWGVHGFSVDTDGNVYVAEVDNGGAQKYRPRKGANPAMMLGKPLRVAWK
jgi:DNA-binding beta-propeller fold protein YncE